MKFTVKHILLTLMVIFTVCASAYAQVDFGSDALVSFNNLAQVSPNDLHVAYVTADNLGMTNATIWVAKPNDSERVAVAASGEDFWVTNPIWSPDSTQIAYLKVIDAEKDEFSTFSRFELWRVNIDGTENHMLTDSASLNPALGYGGEADIVWNEQGDIVFIDNASYPMVRYALNVTSGEIRKVDETVGDLGELFVGGQPTNVPYFNQTSSPWGGNRLGTCSYTISRAGCAMTSVSMILKYYGANVNPGSLNSWLTSHRGYANGCNIYWATAANYHSGTNYMTYIKNRDWNRLRAELNAGYPVVVRVSNSGRQHWVVVTHYSGSTYYINDPGYSSRKTLASYGNSFIYMVVYHGKRPASNPVTTPTPKITGVSPNPMRPLPVGQRQPITITGSGFASGAKLLFKITDTPGYTYPNRVPTSRSSTKIVYNISVGPNTHNWTVQVINPDGKASNVYAFKVSPYSNPNPVITGVSPNPIRPLPVEQRQPITIAGGGFMSGAKLLFKIVDSPTYTYPDRVPTSLSSNQIVYNISVGPNTHNWTVQVINPDGSASNVFPFRAAPPATKYTLTVTKQDQGTVSGTGISCESDCAESYEQGTQTTLTATPDGNEQTSPSWGPGDVATDSQASYLITVVKSGSGSGHVTSQPGGIDCGADCSEILPAGMDIVLSATPDAGSVFIGWVGNCLGEDDCALTADDNHELEAIFDVLESHYMITASAGEGGVIQPSGEVLVARGATQTFSIIPHDGYEIKDVRIDGVSYGALTEYTFEHVFVEHRLDVSFQSTTLNYTSAFNFDDQDHRWTDVDKSADNPNDDWLCWAAAAANILDWSGWGTDLFNSAQDIFAHFQDSWTNASGLMEYAWKWWFDGTVPSSQAGWAQLNEGGWSSSDSDGGYQSQYLFDDYFHEDWAYFDADTSLWSNGENLMETVDQYIQEGFGTTLAIYNGISGHALSVWGYEYDEYGDYTGIWVSDSDDYADDLKLLTVSLDNDTNLWYLDQFNYYGYNNWFIGGVQALEQFAEAAVPEPGTMLLIGVGLLLIKVLRRNRKK